MPRLLVKGGIWRNTEDEILKAAVMKYGKNQWARIASLLHRKSAKQCKSRWYEWLDPSVKKTEWSREEEEKLLHLARLFPTQWRTIAPLVGRTAAQCIEHYEQLLDRAQQKDSDLGQDDPRRLRPGEIDPNPETKPARPDPVDMDEDELEMLAEARARLANTQGKKAKRKARERQMDEARRLASLQKRRELRAAGILMRKRRRQKWGIDYNQEIPFEKKVPSGFFDTSEETAKTLDVNWKTLSSDKMESTNSKERERQERQKDAEKLAKRKESDMPAVIFSQTGTGNEPAKKRSKLVLPAPQITDEELEQVVKVGMASEAARREAEASGIPQSATHELIGDYTVTPAISALGGSTAMLPPARTPAVEDSLMKEARNLLIMSTAETPLKGGANEPLFETDISTPAGGGRTIVQTPNTVLSLPFRTPQAPGAAAAAGGMTPSQRSELMAAGKTPLRDRLNINSSDGFDAPTPSSTASERGQRRQQSADLRDKLRSLPTPRNDFEIVLPDDEEEAAGKDDMEGVKEGIQSEDMSDLERQLMEEEEARRAAEFRRQSQAVQRGLPRPVAVNDNIMRPPEQLQSLTDMQRAEELIKAEMLVMLHYDALQNPAQLPKGAPKPSASEMTKHAEYLKTHQYRQVNDADMEQAKQLLAKEMASVKAMVGHGDLSLDAYSRVWEECYAQVLYVPSQQHFTRTSMASKKERIESLEKRLELHRLHMSEEAKRAGKLEKKLRVTHGGYQGKQQAEAKLLSDVCDQLEQSRIELSTFHILRQHEVAAIPRRVGALREDVERQEQRERVLQERYDKLVFELQQLQKQAMATASTTTSADAPVAEASD